MATATNINIKVGKILEEEFLIPCNLKQSELAEIIKIPRARLSDIISGKRAISYDSDVRLCHYFRLEKGYFTKIQNKLLVEETESKIANELKNIKPRKNTIKTPPPTSQHKQLHVGVICGGPSLERGISLNSARSILDHLNCDEIEIHPIYVDRFKNFYSISKAQMYSNTPSDFDFKLAHMAKKLNRSALRKKLEEIDIVFPVIHGAFGEDGELQEILNDLNIPFIGCDSSACKKMFNKQNNAKILNKHNYHSLPSQLLDIKEPLNNQKIIRGFYEKHQLKRSIIKPLAGGSSIGVFSAYTVDEAIEKANRLFQMEEFKHAIIEPFCKGHEFTIIVLQNSSNEPVALVPSEIQISYDNGQIFDYRRKYLPTNNTMWLCPPHFDDQTVVKIQKQAEDLFKIFKMRDFARLDGWILDDGKILFSDFNPISGMEQNSFIFQQASRIGLTHRELLWHVVRNACQRYQIPTYKPRTKNIAKKSIRVLFGGNTAEKQVSVMSGTNVWLKLKQSEQYDPTPYLLDKKGQVWQLPYTYALNHTVEEIYENCLTANVMSNRLDKYVKKIRQRLGYLANEYDVKNNLPKKISFDDFLKNTKEKNDFLFLALHGGDGENGIIQQKLDSHNIQYNGSGPEGSDLCMNKYLTGNAISKMGDAKIITAPKKQIQAGNFENHSTEDCQLFWKKLQKEFQTDSFIIKPQNDGCSAGIIRLNSADDLDKYISLVKNNAPTIPENTFNNQNNIIEMPLQPDQQYIIESFIKTDAIHIQNNELIYKPKTGWLEFTVGVLESEGIYFSLNPSITVTEGDVLSVEEKFQGGTGVNITPPPEHIVSTKMLENIKRSIEKVAQALGIKNYARIDIFYNVKTNVMMVIEANTLPGLTPSTVIYHQALTENPPMYPIQFIEKIIALKTD